MTPLARAVNDLLSEAPCLPADLIEELVLYRGDPEPFGDQQEIKVRGACTRLIGYAEDIPDTLEAELYAYGERLGIDTIELSK